MKKVYSPLIKNGDTKFLRTFSVPRIIRQYKEEINLDVSRFFLGLDEVELYECINTGYRFYYPASIIGDSQFYKDIATIRKSYYSERWEHNQALKYIKRTDRVIEIGSGFGSFLNMMSNIGIENIRGLEFSLLAIETCSRKGFNVDNILIEDVVKEESKYDVVCSFQVLEHISNVNTFIESSIKVLNIGGRMIIGVPNNNPYIMVSDDYHTLNLPPHHAGLWSSDAFKALENIFPIKLVAIEFEPLAKTVDYFINLQIESRGFFISTFFKIMDKFFKTQFRRVLPKFINGRNILVVFEKKKSG